MKPPFDLGTAGSVASLASLVIGFVSGVCWWRIRTLVARDRETTDDLLDPFEVYSHLQKVRVVLGELLIGAPGGRRAALRQRQRAEVQKARDGVLLTLDKFNTYFSVSRRFKIAGTHPMVRAARYHRVRGPLTSAVTCYERALELSDDGETLSDEDHRACVQGLQYCAVVLGDREEAARWAREAVARKVCGCVREDLILGWFLVYRWTYFLRLVIPTRLGSRRSGIGR